MSKKQPYLKLDFGSLNNVKLVLGNGFDIACGLKSSYGHFFYNQKSLYDEIEKWINNNAEFPPDGNAWDLMFLLLSKDNVLCSDCSKINWKDIEDVMKRVLVKKSRKIPYSFYNIIYKKQPVTENTKLIKKYLADRCDLKDPDAAYAFLFSELIKFEGRFSDFLRKQQNDPTYNENARMMLNESGLLKFTTTSKRNGLTSIDSFNYTTPQIFNELPGYVSIRHINGRIDNDAFFGIDSDGIDVDNPAYRFTKASRRIGYLIEGGREEFKRQFKNIVIYGHSLSEADYSYFFSIFDAFTLEKYNKYGERLVIAFTNYCEDEKSNKENRNKLANSLNRMLAAYEKHVSPGSNRQSLIELLAVSDRVGFAVVDTSVLKH